MFSSRIIGGLFLATMPAHKGVLVLGALLMLANTAVDIGKAVLFFPVIETWGRRSPLVLAR